MTTRMGGVVKRLNGDQEATKRTVPAPALAEEALVSRVYCTLRFDWPVRREGAGLRSRRGAGEVEAFGDERKELATPGTGRGLF